MYLVVIFWRIMTARATQELIVEYKHDIGRFFFYPNIVVGELYEGVHATKENTKELTQFVKKVYGEETPFVYISHRLYPYSMDPIGSREVVKMFSNFIGFAIVSQNKYRRMIVSLEKFFIVKPIGVFYELESAFTWAEELIENNSKRNA